MGVQSRASELVRQAVMKAIEYVYRADPDARIAEVAYDLAAYATVYIFDASEGRLKCVIDPDDVIAAANMTRLTDGSIPLHEFVENLVRLVLMDCGVNG